MTTNRDAGKGLIDVTNRGAAPFALDEWTGHEWIRRKERFETASIAKGYALLSREGNEWTAEGDPPQWHELVSGLDPKTAPQELMAQIMKRISYWRIVDTRTASGVQDAQSAFLTKVVEEIQTRGIDSVVKGMCASSVNLTLGGRRKLALFIYGLRQHAAPVTLKEQPYGFVGQCTECGLAVKIPAAPAKGELCIQGRATEVTCPKSPGRSEQG